MPSLAQAEAADAAQAEALYKQILSDASTSPDVAETALVKLGALYRDQKSVFASSCAPVR